MKEVGKNTITEATYDNRRITVVTDENEKIVKSYEEPVPSFIVPAHSETTYSVEGTKVVTSNSQPLLESTDVVFK